MDLTQVAAESSERSSDSPVLLAGYLRTVPRRRLKAAALVYGQGLSIDEAAPLLGVKRSTVANETKAFADGLKALRSPDEDGPVPLNRSPAVLAQQLLRGLPWSRWESLAESDFSQPLWTRAVLDVSTSVEELPQ